MTPKSGRRRTTMTDHKPRSRGNAEPHVLTRGHERVAHRARHPHPPEPRDIHVISVPLCLGVSESSVGNHFHGHVRSHHRVNDAIRRPRATDHANQLNAFGVSASQWLVFVSFVASAFVVISRTR